MTLMQCSIRRLQCSILPWVISFVFILNHTVEFGDLVSRRPNGQIILGGDRFREERSIAMLALHEKCEVHFHLIVTPLEGAVVTSWTMMARSLTSSRS